MHYNCSDSCQNAQRQCADVMYAAGRGHHPARGAARSALCGGAARASRRNQEGHELFITSSHLHGMGGRARGEGAR